MQLIHILVLYSVSAGNTWIIGCLQHWPPPILWLIKLLEWVREASGHTTNIKMTSCGRRHVARLWEIQKSPVPKNHFFQLWRKELCKVRWVCSALALASTTAHIHCHIFYQCQLHCVSDCCICLVCELFSDGLGWVKISKTLWVGGRLLVAHRHYKSSLRNVKGNKKRVACGDIFW